MRVGRWRLKGMAKDPKPREPTWWERAAALTKAAAYTDNEPGAVRPVPGRLALLNDRDRVLVVYDMRTKVWASDAERLLYETAGSQAHGAARPSRIDMPISMSIEYVVRDINAKGGTAYRLPPASKLKWYSGTTPPKPKRERTADLGTCTTLKVGRRIIARCNACWIAGHYEHAASEHNTTHEADAWAAKHRCKT